MIRLALLWHMHQPFYQDLATGEHILPWVRMHALKDYRGMVDVLEPFAGVRATFNLVPSLIVQLQAFSDGRARDRHLAVGLAPAESLGAQDRAFLVANGFHAAYHRMIAPFPRYQELHGTRESAATWPVEAVRDLQVWHKLVWMDPDWLARDPRLQALLDKGRGFSEDDKQALGGDRARAHPVHARRLSAGLGTGAGGAVHLTVLSPHPAAPVRHRRAPGRPPSGVAPAASVPPADRRARAGGAGGALPHQIFGRPPLGMWPSEGSVSNLVVPIVAAEGLRWLATDEDVLARSLGEPLPRDHEGLPLRPDLLYRPYEVQTGGARARVLFRDHVLSDRIGFVYQSWDPQHAADDFLWRIRESARRFAERAPGESPVIAIILDGENAWEHYLGGGRPFLRELYGRLEKALDIQTVTMADGRRQPGAHADAALPGIVDSRGLLHLGGPSRRPAGVVTAESGS